MKILKLPFLQVLLWLHYCTYFKFHTVIQPSTFKYINIRALFYFLQFIQSCQPDRFWKRHFKSQWHERYVKVSLYPVTGMLSLSQNVCMYVCMWQLTVQRVVYSGLNIGNRFWQRNRKLLFGRTPDFPQSTRPTQVLQRTHLLYANLLQVSIPEIPKPDTCDFLCCITQQFQC